MGQFMPRKSPLGPVWILRFHGKQDSLVYLYTVASPASQVVTHDKFAIDVREERAKPASSKQQARQPAVCCASFDPILCPGEGGGKSLIVAAQVPCAKRRQEYRRPPSNALFSVDLIPTYANAGQPGASLLLLFFSSLLLGPIGK